ncbi:MAG: TolC family protein [Pirellula sp.]|nr:TolC family protein [Pirellula sp.]
MRRSHFCLALTAVSALVSPGCHLGKAKTSLRATASGAPSLISQLRQSDAIESVNMPLNIESVSPLDLDEASLTPDRFQNISLQECISSALATSRVMRDMGVTVIRNPQGAATNLDPAIVYTDARSGEEAALSAFDANFFASNFFENNDRAFNNSFFGRSGQFQQDLNTSQVGISKRSATGGLYTLRGVSVFDRNNQASNRPEIGNSAWDNFLEAQFRQPLMLGAGTEFNRIAGPGAQPGQLNGVLLARTRTDINLVDFERSVRDYLAEVENAYWDLYYAYRELDARIQVRDIAEEELQNFREDADGGGKRAQTEEQLYRFKADVVDALNGRPIDGTRTNNGSSGGTFRGTGGVRICERKLRLMVGLPINDGVLLHPSDRPSVTKIDFDWAGSVQEALSMREELRRQRWVIKQRELELIASRHFRKPQLDAVSTYRMRGFGSEFTHPFGEDLHEWGLGLDMQMPVGFRRGNAAVRNAQLALARETEILSEQERAVHFGLSNAINEARRAYENLALQEKRLDAIVRQLQTFEADKEFGRAELDVRLETHRRLLDARLRYHQAEVEYALALRNVNVERGTLLRYCNVWLNETAPSAEVVAKSVRRTNAQDYSISPDNRDIVIGNPRVP